MWWIIVGIVLVVAVTGYFVFGRSSADSALHEVVGRQGSALSGGVEQAPAEPGSEDQAVVGRGVTGPGPGSEPLNS